MRALSRGARLLPLIVLLAWVTGVAGAQPAPLEGTVVRIVDGDTIHVRLSDRVEKVRYIGVNTPEVHHPRKGEEPGGREAAEVNRELVENKHVRLELDVQSRDRYGGCSLISLPAEPGPTPSWCALATPRWARSPPERAVSAAA